MEKFPIASVGQINVDEVIVKGKSEFIDSLRNDVSPLLDYYGTYCDLYLYYYSNTLRLNKLSYKASCYTYCKSPGAYKTPEESTRITPVYTFIFIF
uniref:Uncharacterized protein n=1 Tax=Strongyloides venezuelensis TaxID=75913 RepID=A0A0K0FHM0_STRVS